MQVAETYGIIVSVETEYVAVQSEPGENNYFFAYRIQISNNSAYTVQLMSRKWFIADSTYDIREVEGEGVVGVQPVIAPGDSYTYVSGCQLQSGIGEMWGYYQIARQEPGDMIEVEIPRFNMTVPWLKN